MNFHSLRSVAQLYTARDRDLRKNLLIQKEEGRIPKSLQRHVDETLETFAQNADHQKKIWHLFVDSFKSVKEVETAIKARKLSTLESPDTFKEILILQTVLNLKLGKMNIKERLIRRGVYGLLNASPQQYTTIHYLSDTIADGDVAQSKIWNHYKILESMYGAKISMHMLGSGFGASVQTGFQALQLIGSHTEIETAFHDRPHPSRLSIFVNNASRRKHSGKELAEGSKCLWARVRDPKTQIVHDVIGVDNDVFAPFYQGIHELYVIEGIPEHSFFGDLSRGTQFRSLNNFPYPQFLNAISGGGSPAGFEVRKVDKADVIQPINLEADEFLLADKDKYLNGKCLCAHPDGVIGLMHHLKGTMDDGALTASFTYNGEKVSEDLTFIPTKYLGKHGGENCIWNGSSRGLGGEVFPEVGKSVGEDEVMAEFVRDLPLGTKIKFRKAE